jgi:hypothetical protein
MRWILLGVLLIAPLEAARADSDGYYCSGPGFIAWETRVSSATAEHVLHVVRFSHATGIAATERIVLPEFQVHGMSCDPVTVRVLGWDRRYTVDLRVPGRAVVTSLAEAFDQAQAAPPGNLGFGARAGIVDLEADGRTGEFELVVARVSRRVAEGIDHHTVARLVHRERMPGDRILASRVLMEGIYRETIDSR